MKDMQWQKRYKQTNSQNCNGKRAFNSFAEACSFNKRSGRFVNGSKRREKLHVYRCDECRQWHIGHWPKKDDKAKRRKRWQNGEGKRFSVKDNQMA
jgi:hypothetical protein